MKKVPFNGRTYEFPDDADDDEISEFLAAEPKSLGGFGSNVLESGKQFAGDIYGAVADPVATGKGMLDLVTGGIEKMSGVQGPQAQYADAAWQHAVNRYGGADKAMETFYRDPVGFLGDLSMLFGLGSGMAKGAKLGAQAANLPRVAGAIDAVGTMAGTAAEMTDPLRLATKAAMLPARAPLANPAERMYQSALKPPPGSTSTKEVRDMVRIGLEAGIPVSEGGLKKLWGQIIDLNSKVTAAIDAAYGQRGVTVNRGDVVGRLGDTTNTFRQQVNPVKDVKRIAKSGQEFIEQDATYAPYTQVLPGIQQPGYFPVGTGKTLIPEDMPAPKAQAIKVGTYRQLKDKAYGELKNSAIEAQKALARGIKEELAAAIPEIASLNEAESKRLGLTDALERAVRRESNHQLVGIGSGITAGGVFSATGSKELAFIAGMLKSVLDNSYVKSRVAIAINRAQQLNPKRFGPARMATATGRIDEYLDRLRAAAAEAQRQEAIAQP